MMTKVEFDNMIRAVQELEEWDRKEAVRQSEKVSGQLVLILEDVHPDELRDLLDHEFIAAHKWTGPLL